ncbi:unnamed protein product [Ambrosiozyma monospora]|uniref:Unnamed protein product n=1 Tax=Ambrosiozyma monospora TaxID=43982 RepID=A0ACB5TD45_AMBMO|nr:unnamed protein product [Ambrosiozyma monospora]
MECGFFNEIEPCTFTTFATPHLGVRFFKTERCWDRIANFLGSHFLGQSGRDMFIHDSDILPQLAERDGKYFKALTMFKKRILLANVKYDRTVAFYTSYITNYSPFDNWSAVDIKYINELPNAIVDQREYTPKIVDFANTKVDLSRNPSFNFRDYSGRRTFIVGLFVILVPLFFPLVLTVSWIGSFLSNRRNSRTKTEETQTLWNNVYKIWKGESAKFEDEYEPTTPDQLYNPLATATAEIIEDGLYEPQSLGPTDENESINSTIKKKQELKVSVKYEIEQNSATDVLNHLRDSVDVGNLEKLDICQELEPLPFDGQRQMMLNNLNSLKWTKIACFLSSLNAHESIVARRGFHRTSAGAPVLYLWGTLIRSELVDESNDKPLVN